ncbi:MAG: hypothetical protein ACLU4N_02490 [Butyricimonas faecihominis]
MKEETAEVEEVVVTGYFNRTKQSSTGAEVSVKGGTSESGVLEYVTGYFCL